MSGRKTYFPSNVTPRCHTNYPLGLGNTSFTPVAESRWVPWSKGQMLPAHAVIGGRDCDGTSIYVGRLHHKQDLIPAKVIPMKHVAYVCYDGKEIPYTSCEILCHEHPNWVASSNGHVPEGAIPVGHTNRGETLFAARFNHNGSLAVGKLHPSHRTCYIPFGGKEIANSNYEVLIGFTPVAGPKWVPWSKRQMLPAHAVIGGRDCDGTSIYVGRLHHKQDLIPAKVIPMKHVAYVCYDGKEIPYTSCEILCYERPNWIASSNGHVPAGALQVGHTKSGEALYAARFNHNGSLAVGKLHPSHRTCYIPFGGKEVANSNYEVLIG